MNVAKQVDYNQAAMVAKNTNVSQGANGQMNFQVNLNDQQKQ